jgi:hypothetical protein
LGWSLPRLSHLILLWSWGLGGVVCFLQMMSLGLFVSGIKHGNSCPGIGRNTLKTFHTLYGVLTSTKPIFADGLVWFRDILWFNHSSLLQEAPQKSSSLGRGCVCQSFIPTERISGTTPPHTGPSLAWHAS